MPGRRQSRPAPNMNAPLRSSMAQTAVARAILPVCVAGPLLAPWLWPVSPALAGGLIFGPHLSLCYGTFVPNAPLFGPVVTGFPGAPDEVWLTIDDGPDPADTPRILDALDAGGARATFFVRGDRAQRQPGLIREIARRGHALGNHTYHHPQRTFWGLPPGRIAAEMDRCSAVLRDITGQAPGWFRAPVGMTNPFVHRAAQARGLRMIGWSARAFDAGRRPVPAADVVSRIARDLRPGGIALLHEGPGSAQGRAAGNVTAVLGFLRSRGWRAVTPEEERTC